MVNSPLVRIMALLTDEEMQQLRRLVNSSFFNDVHRYQEKVDLFEYLSSCYPVFDPERIDRHKVGALLWPNRSDGHNELERTMSLLLPLVRQLITYNFFASASMYSHKADFEDHTVLLSHVRQELAMMRFYRMRLHERINYAPDDEGNTRKIQYSHNYTSNIYRKLQELRNSPRDARGFDEFAYLDLQQMWMQVEQEKARVESLDEGNFLEDVNLLQTFELADEQYLSNKLFLVGSLMYRDKYARMFADNPALRARYESNLSLTMDIVGRLLSSHKQYRTPLLSLHIAFFKLASRPFEEQATEAQALRLERMLSMPKYNRLVTQERLDSMMVILRSFWNKRYGITTDKSDLHRNVVLYKRQIENLSPKSVLQVGMVTSALIIMLRYQEFDWISNFLSTFDQDRLSGVGDNQAMAWDIYWAVFHVYEGDYKSARSSLPEYKEYSKIFYFYVYALAACTDTKIRYAAGTLLEEDGHNMVRATTTRMRRYETVQKTLIEQYAQFVLFTQNLARIQERYRLGKVKPAAKQMKTFLADLNGTTLAEKAWLLEQYKDLEAKIGNI
jgi:hypothetical protein